MYDEALDCWDDYPMEHGCICGNDCPPPPLPLDPMPWVYEPYALSEIEHHHIAHFSRFEPRPGYSQNREDYA